MQLSYRGISYSVPAAIVTVPGPVIGQYRGATLRSRSSVHSLISQPRINLKYRGASYQAVAQVNFSRNTWMGEDMPEAA